MTESIKLEKPDLNKPAFKLMTNAAQKINIGVCPTCSKPIWIASFRDALSRKEYSISGLCQTCQDKVFTNTDNPTEDEE